VGLCGPFARLPFVTNLLPRYLLATLLALSAAPLLAQDLPAGVHNGRNKMD
jgi:hypothetical protein